MNIASILILGLVAGQNPAAPQHHGPKLLDSAFLGVEVAPSTGALTDQLGLPPHTGLTVERLLPDSPAAEVLHEHDILTKLDDQILIAPYQFAVLVRGHHPGDEIRLTYVRGGKTATATVKLGTKALPPLGDGEDHQHPRIRIAHPPFPEMMPDRRPEPFRAEPGPAQPGNS